MRNRSAEATACTSTLDGTATYTYDATSQLTGADYNYQTDESYSYDANGNRTNTGYTTGDANQLTSNGTYAYQYDSEGNRTARFVDEDSSGTLNTGDTDVAEYTWDFRNRLTAVTNRATYGGDATQAVDYIYDVNNRLVGKILDPDGEGEDPATEEYYVYDGDQILLRFDGPDVEDVRNRYLWAPTVDLLLSDEKLTAPDEPGDIYWALGDNLNTVRDIARYNSGNDTTTIVNHRVYDAYGNLTDESDPDVDLIFSYTGRLFDEATGLQSNWRRWYDPAVGRWLSEDPIGFTAGDANLYRYVANSPTNYADPSGQMVVKLLLRPRDPRVVYLWFASAADLSNYMESVRRGHVSVVQMNLTEDQWRLVTLAAGRPAIESRVARILNAIHGMTWFLAQWTYRRNRFLSQIGYYIGSQPAGFDAQRLAIGPCGQWVDEALAKMPQVAENEKLKIVSAAFNRIPGATASLTGHNVIRLEFLTDPANRARVSGIAYLDDGTYGGDDHIFFPSDYPAGYFGGEWPEKLDDGRPAPFAAD